MRSSIFSATLLVLALLVTTPAILSQMRGGGMGTSPQPQFGTQLDNMQTIGPAGAQNSAQVALIAQMRRNLQVEIDLSKLALKNSSNDQIKALARQTIAENHRNERELTDTASSNTFGPQSFDEGTPSKTRKAEKQMKKMSGAQFDGMYLSQMKGSLDDDQEALGEASTTMCSIRFGAVLTKLRDTTDQRANQLAQVAQSENVKLE